MTAQQVADTVFLKGKVVTIDAKDRIVSAVAVKDGKILAVGSDDEIKALANSETKVVDLDGKTMLPGFYDSHTHVGMAMQSFNFYIDGHTPPNKNVADLLGRVKEATQSFKKGKWIIAHCSMFADQKLDEKRLPNRDELDSVAPKHPVVLLVTGHLFVLNSYALRELNITKDSESSPELGTIEKDSKTGEPTGVLHETHALPLHPHIPYDEMKALLLNTVKDRWLPMGYTTVCSFIATPEEFRAWQELAQDGHRDYRMLITIGQMNNRPEFVDYLKELGIITGFGDEWLKITGVKIFTDGTYMTLTAGTNEPYINMAEEYGENHHGLMRFDNFNVFNNLVVNAHDAGLRLCIHAMGDKAQDWALTALENAVKANPRDHRHRIEHFGCEMGNAEQRRRAEELGIIPVITSAWLWAYGDFFEKHLGKKRADEAFAFRSMVDAGLKVVNSADQIGTEHKTLDPFFSIWTMVERETFFGHKFTPHEAITVPEALRMYTINAAYCAFEEDLKGSIEPGKLADLITISDDILSCPTEKIKDIVVDTTIVNGEVVFERHAT